MSKELLKEYLNYALSEDFFLRGQDSEKSGGPKKSFFSRIKSLFVSDPSEDIAQEWIEDQSTYYDVEIDETFADEVRDFAKRKYKKALSRSRGSKEKAETLLMKAISIRFQKKLKDLETKYAKELSDEEDL
jgi:hypothetical protein